MNTNNSDEAIAKLRARAEHPDANNGDFFAWRAAVEEAETETIEVSAIDLDRYRKIHALEQAMCDGAFPEYAEFDDLTPVQYDQAVAAGFEPDQLNSSISIDEVSEADTNAGYDLLGSITGDK